MRDGALVLADGTVFRGRSVGADGLATGEAVFNTAMTGYQEVATDPSYAGQVVVMTAPHIGNYGVSSSDAQAESPWCTGFVMRSAARRDSSWRSQGGFTTWLRDRGVVALSEIDTRRLTRHLRAKGAMPVALGTGVTDRELRDAAAAAPMMEGRDLTRLVTTRDVYRVDPEGEPVGRVVAYDFGIKRDILAALVRRGLEVHVVPATTTAANAMALRPDGIFLSNGPGDPEPLEHAIAAVGGLLGKVPVFGICLGHQVLGLELAFGHHGGNHPVRRISDGRVEITSQNHGFAVDLWSLTALEAPQRRGLPGPDLLPVSVQTEYGSVETTHQNLNDGTLEGLSCRDIPAFSVQYHPEAAPGPNDAAVIFDRFAAMLGGDDRCRAVQTSSRS
jgi:carbamoyl-phosphate synthase small subunit